MEEFLDQDNVIAVVGASRNRDKYGYRVYKDLKEKGFRVYPVNPNAREIDGDKCYGSLKDLPEKPDVVNTVVPPEVTERIVRECRELGIDKVWMQPGSESDDAIEFCEENGIQTMKNVCVMRES